MRQLSGIRMEIPTMESSMGSLGISSRSCFRKFIYNI